MAFLLDTNVVSELRRGRKCDPSVREWSLRTSDDRHYLSVLTLGEIRKGIEVKRRTAQAQAAVFENWLDRIEGEYTGEILPVDGAVASRWGRLEARRSLPVIDGLLAATALVHELTLATRNTPGFKGTGVSLVNPFE